MIRLKWLKLKAFRSFAEEARIDFPDSGLVLIRGISGSGKSTVLLAIAYALDMCPFPASELQAWNTDADMQVQVGFNTSQGEVIINRGKKNSLKIGDVTVTGAKAIAEGIRKLFGLDLETLQAITYRPQDTGGLFLGLTDGEKKDFLTRILGLDTIEKAVDASEAQVKMLTPLVLSEEQSIAQLESELAVLLTQTVPEETSYGELVMERNYVEGELMGVDAQIKAVWAKAAAEKANAAQDPKLVELQQTLEAARQHYKNLTTANGERHREYQVQQEGLRKKMQEITRQETLKLGIMQNIETHRGQLRHALEGKCSMCQRTWEQAAAKAAELQQVIANLEAQMKMLGDFTGARKQVEEDLRVIFVMDPTIEQFRFAIGQLEGQVQELQHELTAGPQGEAQELVNRLNVSKATHSTRMQGLSQQIASIESMNAKIRQAKTYADTNVKTLRSRIQGRQVASAKLQVDLNAERDFLALMGKDGFLGVIFDDVLREIEIEANERLGRLANVSHVTIHFKSEVTTQKGTVNKTITPIVYVSGVEAKLRSGLSGGMYTSVEGVVDLAVMSVVQRRTGALPGFLFLDESFNGQGTSTKEAVMEVLREYGAEKLVVVIDHSSEFKEMFSQFIDVTCRDGKSEIT